MFKGRSKNLGILFIIFLSLAAPLSTLAATLNQITVTPTITISGATVVSTATPPATATATLTPTITPSPTATPAYPSVEDIHQQFKDDFDAINSRLDNLTPNPDLTHITNILDNLASSAILKFFSVLISIFGVAKLGSKFKNDQDRSEGKAPNKTLVNLESVFGSVFKFFMILLLAGLFLLSVLYLGQSIAQSNNQAELATISTKIDRLQSQLGIPPQSTPPANSGTTSSQNFVPQSQPDMQGPLNISLVIGAGILILFFWFAIVIASNQIKIYESAVTSLNWGELGRKLLPAGLLVLILYLLSSPIDTILLPILIPFFLFAFFDVVLLYPNSYLQKLVVRHYKKIIFLSVFGVWLGVFHLLQNYLYPFWNVASDYLRITLTEYFRNQPNLTQLLNQSRLNISTLLQFAWDLLPFILAILFALFPAKRIRKISKEKYIDRIVAASSKGQKM